MTSDLPTYETVQVGDVELRMFGCDTHGLRLSVDGCAGRWNAAQDRPGRRGRAPMMARARVDEGREDHLDSMSACARCPLGAYHAGGDLVQRSRLFGVDMCPRCEVGGVTRMIGGRVCVSCYNRERETVAGKNARGNAPVKAKALHPVALRVVVDNTVRPVVDRAVDLGEVARRTLRTTNGAVAFAPSYRALAPIQLELRFA